MAELFLCEQVIAELEAAKKQRTILYVEILRRYAGHLIARNIKTQT